MPHILPMSLCFVFVCLFVFCFRFKGLVWPNLIKTWTGRQHTAWDYVTSGETESKSERLVPDLYSSLIYLICWTMQPTLNGRQVLIDIQLLHLTIIVCPWKIGTIYLGGITDHKFHALLPVFNCSVLSPKFNRMSHATCSLLHQSRSHGLKKCQNCIKKKNYLLLHD